MLWELRNGWYDVYLSTIDSTVNYVGVDVASVSVPIFIIFYSFITVPGVVSTWYPTKVPMWRALQ
jgi:hypothetical protein